MSSKLDNGGFGMKFLKSCLALLLAFAFILPSESVFAKDEYDYLALGDSLAVGYNEYSQVGKGYADFFAGYLETETELTSYNKGFSFPGYTTSSILNDFEKNVEKPVVGSPPDRTVAILDAVADAEIVTLSVGANDVLKAVSKDEQGNLTFNFDEVAATIQQMTVNLNKILKKLVELNPEVEVYVMGFYNPFPTYTGQVVEINYLVQQMDYAAAQVVGANGMHFVSVKDVIASDFAKYLPNPENIHPSEAGYEVMGLAFLEKWKVVNPKEPIEPPITPITFSDVSKDHWSYAILQNAVAQGIIKGYPDGTFKPDAQIEKVHLTSIFSRALKLKSTKPVAFLDVGHLDATTKAEIAAAHEALIVRNFTGYFNPHHLITRVEVARMLYAANTHLKGKAYVPSELALFTDTNMLNKDDQVAISLLKQYGVTNGYPDGTFRPYAQITRAEATAMLQRFVSSIQ